MGEEGGADGVEEVEGGGPGGGAAGEDLDLTQPEGGEDSICQICRMGQVKRVVRGRWCWQTAFYTCGTCGATTNARAIETGPKNDDSPSLKASIWLGPPAGDKAHKKADAKAEAKAEAGAEAGAADGADQAPDAAAAAEGGYEAADA